MSHPGRQTSGLVLAALGKSKHTAPVPIGAMTEERHPSAARNGLC